jgi:hypothetical protein
LSTEELGKILAFKPQLMACSIEERWKPLVKYLYHLNVSKDGMKRMLVVQPTIFCLDLETVIAPKVPLCNICAHFQFFMLIGHSFVRYFLQDSMVR